LPSKVFLSSYAAAFLFSDERFWLANGSRFFFSDAPRSLGPLSRVFWGLFFPLWSEPFFPLKDVYRSPIACLFPILLGRLFFLSPSILEILFPSLSVFLPLLSTLRHLRRLRGVSISPLRFFFPFFLPSFSEMPERFSLFQIEVPSLPSFRTKRRLLFFLARYRKSPSPKWSYDPFFPRSGSRPSGFLLTKHRRIRFSPPPPKIAAFPLPPTGYCMRGAPGAFLRSPVSRSMEKKAFLPLGDLQHIFSFCPGMQTLFQERLQSRSSQVGCVSPISSRRCLPDGSSASPFFQSGGFFPPLLPLGHGRQGFSRSA